MALGLLNKLTNFLMPVEEVIDAPDTSDTKPMSAAERKAQLRVHSQSALRVYVGLPLSFDDVRLYADYLRSNVAVVVNFDSVDRATQERIHDFMSGILYVLNGTSQRVSDTVHMYLPAHVDVNKELYAYSIPTYIRKKNEL
ncbi:MAG: cell division protein SepF [Negativicutes bacterium]|nr:cell division protein SepF [Negativicutes bacterium]